MTLDIRGGKKNTAVNRSSFVALDELLSNAIDSYLIRKEAEPNAPPFLAQITVTISKADLLGDEFKLDVACSDNGAGFGDPQVKAFVTKDSSYKDDLKIPGIGKCKGVGRIQFFHHFQIFSLDSIFSGANGPARRTLRIDSSLREVSEGSFLTTPVETRDLLTTIRLDNKQFWPEETGAAPITDTFDCRVVARHLYTSFLQRLIVLKSLVGDFSITVNHVISGSEESAHINAKDLPNPTEVRALPLRCVHGNTGNLPSLTVTRYSFPAEKFPEFSQEIALCANSAIVTSLTRNYLKSPADRRRPVSGNFELLLVESDALETKVNQQRDGFDIPRECGQTRDLVGEFSLDDVIESLEDYFFEVVTPPDFDRNELVKAAQEKFGITVSMLDEVNVKIHYGDTEENIAKRVLRKYQDEIVRDTSVFMEIKQQLLELDPRSTGFREKVNELSWKYTSTIRKVDMANLSQLVVRRSAMIEVLRHAVSRLLACQKSEEGKISQDERIIHNVFFPTGKDDSDANGHDIWLLNEEYQYFEHIASDKPLSSLTWLGGDKIFSEDIDESLKELFQRNNDLHSGKRPDIAIFSAEGSVIIIEFKAPGVPIQEHINDLAQYSRLLAAKSDGKLKKFYGYLIGTELDHSRMPTGWTRFPNGGGYFQTGAIEDPETGRRYGELYSELLFYSQFIDRAERRLSVYKKKLNVRL